MAVFGQKLSFFHFLKCGCVSECARVCVSACECFRESGRSLPILLKIEISDFSEKSISFVFCMSMCACVCELEKDLNVKSEGAELTHSTKISKNWIFFEIFDYFFEKFL